VGRKRRKTNDKKIKCKQIITKRNRKWRYSRKKNRRRKQNKAQNRWNNRGKRIRRKFTTYR